MIYWLHLPLKNQTGEDQTYNRGEQQTVNSKPSFAFEIKYVTQQKSTKSYVESDLQCITLPATHKRNQIQN